MPARQKGPMSLSHRDCVAERFHRDVVPHIGHLRRSAYFLAPRRADAEDLMQETMLKAYTGLDTFDSNGDIKAWLSRIMFNVMVDDYRKAKRRPTWNLTADFFHAEAAGAHRSGWASTRSAELCALDRLPGDLSHAVGALPEALQMVIYYSDVQGYSNIEIADILGIPVGTVASRLHRARLQLRNRLPHKVISRNA